MRFSLKTLLLFAAVSAVAIGIWAREYRQQQRKEAALKLLKAAADYREGDDGLYVGIGVRLIGCGFGPSENRREWTADELAQLRYLDVASLDCRWNDRPDDGWGKHLAPLTKLRSLRFYDCELDDNDLREFVKLTHVREMDLSASPASPGRLDLLAQIPGLVKLSFQRESGNLELDERFDRLTELHCVGANSTALTNLRRLTSAAFFGGEAAPSETSIRLKRLPELTSLRISGKQLRVTHDNSFELVDVDLSGEGSADFVAGIRPTKVVTLRLCEKRLSPNLATALSQMKELEDLSLSGLVSAEVNNALKQLPKLKSLTFRECTFAPSAGDLSGVVERLTTLRFEQTELPGGEAQREEIAKHGPLLIILP